MPIVEIEKGGLWNNTLHHLCPNGIPRVLPGIIIVGDGHGSRAGGMCHAWAGGAAGYLREHVIANRVCLHMEINQEQVAGVPLPPALEGARRQTFGFEIGALNRARVVEPVLWGIVNNLDLFHHDIYNAHLVKDIIDSIDIIIKELQYMSKNFLALDGAFEAEGVLVTLTDDADSIVIKLFDLHSYFADTYNATPKDRPSAVPGIEVRHKMLIETCKTAYRCIAGAWRDKLNPIFSRKINQKILEHQGHLHIVSIGDAHLSPQPRPGGVSLPPMQDFIQPSVGMWGILDKSQGM